MPQSTEAQVGVSVSLPLTYSNIDLIFELIETDNIMLIYVISAFFIVFIIWMIYCVDCFNYRPSRLREPASLRILTNQNEEYCICLDMDNTGEWSILQCGHKFHGTCVSTWLRSHQTYPVCRFRVVPV